MGFLFGFSLASSYAAYHLLDEYKQASAALQASVEELQASTQKVCLTLSFVIYTHLTVCIGVGTYSEDRGSGERSEGSERLFSEQGGHFARARRGQETVRRFTRR